MSAVSEQLPPGRQNDVGSDEERLGGCLLKGKNIRSIKTDKFWWRNEFLHQRAGKQPGRQQKEVARLEAEITDYTTLRLFFL